MESAPAHEVVVRYAARDRTEDGSSGLLGPNRQDVSEQDLAFQLMGK